jgi:hypothetical protein
MAYIPTEKTKYTRRCSRAGPPVPIQIFHTSPRPEFGMPDAGPRKPLHWLAFQGRGWLGAPARFRCISGLRRGSHAEENILSRREGCGLPSGCNAQSHARCCRTSGDDRKPHAALAERRCRRRTAMPFCVTSLTSYRPMVANLVRVSFIESRARRSIATFICRV